MLFFITCFSLHFFTSSFTYLTFINRFLERDTWWAQCVKDVSDLSLVNVSFFSLHTFYSKYLLKWIRLITTVFSQLLLEHLEAISPDPNDLLHELLQDLGDVPDVETLLGTVIPHTLQAKGPFTSTVHMCTCTFFSIIIKAFYTSCGSILGEGAVDQNDPNRESALSQLAKTEISLTLTSKLELLEGDDRDLKTLMTKYVNCWRKLLNSKPVVKLVANCSLILQSSGLWWYDLQK